LCRLCSNGRMSS
ncbi:hypothetical protein AB1N83_009711, partial [Pleurotus pulmonarius]